MGSSCIRHVVTVDNGNTWSNSTMVLNQATVGHYMETFSGKWFPRLFGSRGGGMVLVTDGGANNTLAPFMSYAPGASAMTEIVSAAPGTITTHPPGTRKSPFLCHFIPQKRRSFCQVGTNTRQRCCKKSRRFRRQHKGASEEGRVAGADDVPAGCRRGSCRCLGEKTALFAPFIYKMHHFTKTGSGQT